MALKDQISAELKEAMKARDQLRVDTLRSVLSAFSYRKIEAGTELTEDQQLDVVRKLVKQRADSIAEFSKAGRTDLVDKESAEREILATFLPAAVSPEAIRAAVDEVVSGLPPESRAMGQVMKGVREKLKGQEADGNEIRKAVEAALKS